MKKGNKILLGLLGVSLLLAGCGAKEGASTKETEKKGAKIKSCNKTPNVSDSYNLDGPE